MNKANVKLTATKETKKTSTTLLGISSIIVHQKQHKKKGRLHAMEAAHIQYLLEVTNYLSSMIARRLRL